LQFQKIDWSIFDLTSTNLGRVDLCYDRELKANDKDLHLFFENSYKQINSKNDNPTAKLGNNILRIGKRSSSNFFRVYLKPNGKELRFEIELKKTLVKKFQYYLFTNQFEVFEKLLTKHFYNQAIRLFNLENSYCDWLLANFRHVKNHLVSLTMVRFIKILTK
jgi:DNA relaxase NicK